MIPFLSAFEESARIETLREQRYQLWRACLDVPEKIVLSYRSSLSPHERSAAESFRFPLHRSRYIVGRGLLRQIIGQYLNRPPEAIPLSVQLPGGKPRLDHPELRFNLSHSGPVWVCAVSLKHEVGIDLEEIQPGFDWRPIAQRYFTLEEQSHLSSISGEKALGQFFSYWTRKEALTKATGEGLTGIASTARVAADHDQIDLSEGLRDWGKYAAWLALGRVKSVDSPLKSI